MRAGLEESDPGIGGAPAHGEAGAMAVAEGALGVDLRVREPVPARELA